MEDIDECAICFAELSDDPDVGNRGFLPCGCNQFCKHCAEAQLNKPCPLCRTQLAAQPEPLLLHFNFITGQRLHETCHPDETLGIVGRRWKLGFGFKVIFAGHTLDLDAPISSLPLSTGHTLHVVLNMRSD